MTTGSAGSSTDSVSYGSYLALDELLSLQRPRLPDHPDELLFIVVHQASELWFKCILHEMDHLTHAMERGEVMYAVLTVQRMNALVQIVAAQLSALETMPPQHFAQFRGYLGSSSGSQSVQFRALEAASGARDPHFLQVIQEHGPVPELVQRALERPTLEELFERLVAREGVTVQSLYTVGARYLQRTVSQRFLPRLWAVRAEFFNPSRAAAAGDAPASNGEGTR